MHKPERRSALPRMTGSFINAKIDGSKGQTSLPSIFCCCEIPLISKPSFAAGHLWKIPKKEQRRKKFVPVLVFPGHLRYNKLLRSQMPVNSIGLPPGR